MPFSTRLSLALDAGLALPDGPVPVFGATPDTDLSALPRPLVVSRDARVHARLCDAVETVDARHGAAVVIVPREKERARDFLARAAAITDGPLVVDGQKTDGIEPLLRALKARGQVQGPISKAHGKLFWMPAAPDLGEWRAQALEVEGMRSWPGVFSAGRVDPGSRLLAEALPVKLGAHLADLGAGWGWLSAQVLKNTGVQSLHLVETDGIALDCARINADDPRAVFHWADVTRWHAPRLFDTVVMNPPFHDGRKGAPDLGRAFIAKAAEILAPGGQLVMVANRHLPYEAELSALFATAEEFGGDNRFKLLRAARPTRRRR